MKQTDIESWRKRARREDIILRIALPFIIGVCIGLLILALVSVSL